MGTLCTGFASVLFALSDPSATYWAFEFPSTVMVVFGADFVYSSSALFIANTVFPHEQSLAGGLFQTMTRVSSEKCPSPPYYPTEYEIADSRLHSTGRNSIWSCGFHDRVQQCLGQTVGQAGRGNKFRGNECADVGETPSL